MTVLTKEQRAALKRVFDRHPMPAEYDLPYFINCDGIPMAHGREVTEIMSYREFRRTVKQGYGCVMVRWAGMWLGIEPDGYTHS